MEQLLADGAEVYETTQPINSMLGLLVFPREEFVDRIPRKSLAELRAEGWPEPKVVRGYPKARDLRELVRYLRNAIAHFNIAFVTDKRREIVGVRMWNSPSGSRQVKIWEAELTSGDFRKITNRFTALLLDRETAR